MTNTTNDKPVVPVGLSIPKCPTTLHPVLTGNVSQRASNHNQPKINQKTNKNLKDMKIYTYNIRTLSEDHKLEELVEDLENIKWDVVGLRSVEKKKSHQAPIQ